MPFAGFKDWADCMAKMAKRYKKIEIRRKVCGKLQAQHEKKLEIEEIKKRVQQERKEIAIIRKELQEKKKKWIQKAVKGMKVGSFTAWCKRHGFGGVNQACINAAARAGGKIAQKALFAANASKGKYSYPKKKKK